MQRRTLWNCKWNFSILYPLFLIKLKVPVTPLILLFLQTVYRPCNTAHSSLLTLPESMSSKSKVVQFSHVTLFCYPFVPHKPPLPTFFLFWLTLWKEKKQKGHYSSCVYTQTRLIEWRGSSCYLSLVFLCLRLLIFHFPPPPPPLPLAPLDHPKFDREWIDTFLVYFFSLKLPSFSSHNCWPCF